MACDFDITKENIYDYIIEDTPGADEAGGYQAVLHEL